MPYDVESYDYAWLGLERKDIAGIHNPLLNLSRWENDNFHLVVLKLMKDPRYFAWTAKHLLGIELLPQQVVVLQELWNHSLPMLIASRGWGKMLPVDTPIRVQDGWKNIEDIVVGDKVYASNGDLYNVTAKTPLQLGLNMYEITLDDGRSIVACEDHRWIVYDHITDSVNVVTTSQLVPYRHDFPINKPLLRESQRSHDRVLELQRVTGRIDFAKKLYDNVDYYLIADLARSLGYKCSINEDRKSVFINSFNKRRASVVSVTPVGKRSGYCISVDSPDHSYITKDYIVTHNSFILSVYCLLRCLLIPETKIVIVGSAWRQSRIIYEYMENIWNNAPLYRSLCSSNSGSFRDVDRCTMKINDSFAVAIPLGNGKKIRGLRAHTIIADEFACVDGDVLVETKNGLKRIRDIVESGDKTEVLNKEGQYEAPSKLIKTPKGKAYKVTLNNGLWFYCSPRHQVYTVNRGFVNVKELKSGEDICQYDNYYTFPIFRRLPKGRAYELGKERNIDAILQCSHQEVCEFIKGLFHASDFELQYNPETGLCQGSLSAKELEARDIQVLLLKLLVHSEYRDGRIFIKDFSLHRLNYLCDLQINFPSVFPFRISCIDKRDYLSFPCGTYARGSIVNEARNDFTYDYLEGFTIKNVVLHDKPLVLYDYELPETHSFYGSGIVHHNSIPIDIYETVIVGFIAVSKDPVMNHKMAVKRRKMIADGVWTEKDEEIYSGRHKNQSIITGTASYGFEPFAEYWQKYRKTILSRGDLSKIIDKNADNDMDELPDYMKQIDYNEYSIVRIPYELIPEGVMADYQIARARATMHAGIFNMEYSACLTGDSLVITASGAKPIEEIEVGDTVLTHAGKLRKVTKKTYRDYSGIIYKLPSGTRITEDHLVWQGKNSFVEIKNADHMIMPRLRVPETKQIAHISLEDFTHKLVDSPCGQYYYYAPKSQIPVSVRRYIKNNPDKLTIVQLAEKCGISQRGVQIVRQDRVVFDPTPLPRTIRIDFNFGILLAFALTYPSVKATHMGRSVTVLHGFGIGNKLIGRFNKALESSLALASHDMPFFYSQKKAYAFHSVVYDIVIGALVKDGKLREDCLTYDTTCLQGLFETLWLLSGGFGHKEKSVYIEHESQDLLYQLKLLLSRMGVYASVENNRIVMRGRYRDAFWTDVIMANFDLGPTGPTTVKSSYDGYIADIVAETKQYKGIVYNLEVEADSSYCIPEGAVHNCFSNDSAGFFKRSLIESVVANDKNVASSSWPRWCPEPFDATLHGSPDRKYVFGIDPASEVDNFAVVVLEVYPEHSRVVYVWTTNRKQFQQRKRLKLTDIDDYYGFCVRKIRDLMLAFPCVAIGIDTQGGGYQIAEGLADRQHINEDWGEVPIYPVIDPKKPKDTDQLAGQHIIHYIQFANAEWVSQANHGLRKDMEDRVLLLPRYDSNTLSLIAAQDEIVMDQMKRAHGGNIDVSYRQFDTLEECVLNIEELKDELTTIVVSRTRTGREHFDTPEIKLENNKKGRMRKDRYSALIIANMIARSMNREIPPPPYQSHIAGRPAIYSGKKYDGEMYYGNQKLTYDKSVVRVIPKNV